MTDHAHPKHERPLEASEILDRDGRPIVDLRRPKHEEFRSRGTHSSFVFQTRGFPLSPISFLLLAPLLILVLVLGAAFFVAFAAIAVVLGVAFSIRRYFSKR